MSGRAEAGSADQPPAPPALVSLVASGCRLTAGAYAATILDLAARGHLAAFRPRPGELWCAMPADPAGSGPVADFEQPVLDQADRLAGPDGVPFQVLADSHSADLNRAWQQFENAAIRTAEGAGLIRQLLPGWTRNLPVAGALAVLLLAARYWNVVAGLLHHLPGRVRSVPAIVLLVLAAGTVLGLRLLWLLRTATVYRLTRAGRALADSIAPPDPRVLALAVASSRPGPAELSLLAMAVAAGFPVPGLATGPASVPRGARRRAGKLPAGQPPLYAWSSLTGQWRRVPIGPLPRRRFTNAGAVAALIPYLGATCLFGYIAYFAPSVLPGPWRLPVTAALIGAAALCGSRFLVHLREWLTRNAKAEVTGQVIAQWTQRIISEDSDEEDSDEIVHHIALDDGRRRAWHLTATQQQYTELGAGDCASLRIFVRKAQVIEVTSLTTDTVTPAP
jgi:hypothetical protein